MKFNFLKAIVFLLLLSSTGFSTEKDTVVVIWYVDQVRFCLTEDQALATIQIDSINKVDKEIILDLKGQLSAFDNVTAATDTIIEVVKDIVEVERERTDLSRKEVRKLRRKAVGTWFRNAYDKILFALGGVAVGVGIGIGATR